MTFERAALVLTAVIVVACLTGAVWVWLHPPEPRHEAVVDPSAVAVPSMASDLP